MAVKDVFGSRTTSLRAAIAAAAFAAAAMPAQARSLVHYFDFDTPSGSGLAYAGVDRGTSPADFTLKGSSVPRTTGAMGSDYAYYASAANTALWLGDGSASLGCGTTQGFTISFWLKASASHRAWTDFFGFRVGGLDYRCEYVSTSGGAFTMYYNVASAANCAAFSLETEDNVNIPATAGAWQHVAFVFTPNGINPTGTCMIYLGGEKVARMAVRNAGNLQQIHVGSWVRALNGGDRGSAATNTGIDELAVFDYPATAEQVKWLAEYRPAQPAKGPGRAMPFAYLLDRVQDGRGLGVCADNSGTGTDAAYKWQGGYANWPTSGGGALGSAYAFHLKDATTFRVDGASATDGLGASLDSGMTLSFWVKAPANVALWRDFLSFDIGNRYYKRFEWSAANPMHFTVYGSSSAAGDVTLKVDTWQNVCMVWNPAASKMEFYLDGEKTAMTLAFGSPTSADVLKSLTFGPVVFANDGSGRHPGNTSGVYLDEIAVFNHSFSPAQIRWLAGNVPCLPPLDATNLVRTVSADGAWAGGRASWGAREWNAEGGAWADTARTTIWPALEDTEVEAEVAFADGVTVTNDTFVTPRRLALAAAAGVSLPVSAVLKSAEGSRFAPQALEIGGGLRLSVPLYAVNVGGTLSFGAGAKIVFDTANYNDGGTTEALTAGVFALPEGETAADVLSHFGVNDSRFTLSLSADGRTVLVSADAVPVTATWTGAGDGASLGSAANWDCRNASGAKIADALPCAMTRVVVCSGAAALNAPAGTSLPWPYLRLEAGSATLSAAVVDWRGFDALLVPEGVTVDLGGNKLYLSETVRGRGTFTDTAVAGGELHFDIPEDATFTNERAAPSAAGSFALSGTLRLVKDGAGTFKAARTGQTYSGGTRVAAGILKYGAEPSQGIFGARTGDVAVSAGGILDVNGFAGSYGHRFILDGGTLRNTGGDLDVGLAQLGDIGLGADSAFAASTSFGLVGSGYAAHTLALGGNRLAVDIASGKYFYICNMTIDDGMVDVLSGGWFVTGRSSPIGSSNNDIVATNVDFRVNAALELNAKIKARDYEAVYGYNYNSGSAVIEVNGTFRPSAHNYFRGCTMMDGSTIDLSSRTNALPLVSAFTSGAKTLGFEAEKTVRMKFGGYGVTSREPVISWASKPAGIDAVKFRSAPGEIARGFVAKDDGLYVVCGFMILVR